MAESLKCPVCRAENQETTCRRCKADLTLLDKLVKERQQAILQASLALSQGDVQSGQAYAERAHQLQVGPESGRLLAISAFLRKDYHEAFSRAMQFRTE